MEKLQTFIKLADLADSICWSNSIGWKTKYNFIFSKEMSKQIEETGISFDYYNPDTSYEEDVTAYVIAITEKADELRKINNKLT